LGFVFDRFDWADFAAGIGLALAAALLTSRLVNAPGDQALASIAEANRFFVRDWFNPLEARVRAGLHRHRHDSERGIREALLRRPAGCRSRQGVHPIGAIAGRHS